MNIRAKRPAWMLDKASNPPKGNWIALDRAP